MGVNQLVERGAKPEGSLGKNLQGMNQAIFMVLKYDCYGIGYQFNNYGKKIYLKIQSRRINFRGQKRGNKSFDHPPLYPMFQSNGYLTLNPFTESRDTVTIFAKLAINAIGENQKANDVPPTVYLCPPNFELNNWKAVEIPIVYKLE